MLSLTGAARAVISHYSSPPHMPRSAGLRIWRRTDPRRADRRGRTPLAVGIAAEPEKDDVVVQHGGAKVFCEPLAAERLAGAQLDVRKDRDGRTEFVLRNQRCI